MGFVGGRGFIGGSGAGKLYDYKARYVKVLNIGEDTITLDGVIATDILDVRDQFGVSWVETDNYIRQGVNANTLVFVAPMVAQVTFTIWVYEVRRLYTYKDKFVEVLEIGENTFTLAGVIATDVLDIRDQYGIPWVEPDHYVRQGVNLDTLTFVTPMVAQVTFTIWVYQP